MSTAPPERFVRALDAAVPGLPRDILDAFAAVDRDAFVPDGFDPYAVSAPIPFAAVDGAMASTISAPDMVAMMLRQLRIRFADRVLEVGAASGYSAALMAAMGARVTSIEILGDLVERARQTLTSIGSAAQVHTGDGMVGWIDDAPYDRVIFTCAASALPAWVWEQTTADARVVIPLRRGEAAWGGTFCLALQRTDDEMRVEDAIACGFVPLFGEPTVSGAERGGKWPPERIARPRT